MSILLTLVGLFSESAGADQIRRCQAVLYQPVSSQSWKADNAKLDAWLSQDVQKIMDTQEVVDFYPQSLRKVRPSEKVRNDLFFKVFQWLRGRNSIAKTSTNGDFIQSFGQKIQRIKESPFQIFVSGSILNRLSKLVSSPYLRNSQGQASLARFAQFQMEFSKDFRSDLDQYGTNYLNSEAEAQGAINTFAIKIFSLLNGQKIYSRASANSISLLHPIVDAAMDQGAMTPETFQKLQKYLYQAQTPKIESAYERILFDYLARFEKDFPRDQVPAFWTALSRLFTAQVRSLKQKTAEFDEASYYSMALDKGGLSTVLAAYTALGPLTQRQFEFFYRSGGVFQVIDDLLDIQKDQSEGVRTVWTHSLSTGQSFAEPTKQLLVMEKQIEDRLEELTEDFADPQQFQKIYSFGFKMSFLRGLARQKHLVDAQTQALLKGRLSLSLTNMAEFMSNPSVSNVEHQKGSDLWLLGELVQKTEAY